MNTEPQESVKIRLAWSRSLDGLLLSFLSLLLFIPVHATTITWEDRGGEAIRLGAVMGTLLATYTETSGDLRLSEQHLYLYRKALDRFGYPVKKEMYPPLAAEEYLRKSEYDKEGDYSYYADHFSVILLRTADGKGIQQILEKGGSGPVKINNWYQNSAAFQPQSPSNTNHESPIYHINENR